MANQWLRLWHDMPNDPKFRTIARISKQPISLVLSVYLHVLVQASNANERGRTQGLSCEDIGSALDAETSDVEQIVEAMQGRLLEGDAVSGWDKRQPAREDGGAERAKAWRESKKNATSVDANAIVRTPNANERPDKDKDKDLKALNTLSLGSDLLGDESENEGRAEVTKLVQIPYDEIVAAYHAKLPMLPAVRKLSDPRRRKLRARWLEDAEHQSVGYWEDFFAYASQSDFLTGRDGRWTSCDFEWLIEASNHLKVYEGKYENKGEARGAA